MKALLALLLLASALGASGCASDGPTANEIGQQFQRGVRGEGQLTPDVDRSDDPYVKPRG